MSLTDIESIERQKDAEKVKSLEAKLELLDVDASDEIKQRVFRKLLFLGSISEEKVTSPGLKGFDFALRTYLILTDHRKHETLPGFSSDGDCIQDLEIGRPFNLMVDSEKSANGNYTEAMLRGFRLGIYIVGNASPQIEYIDSNILLGEEKVVARDVNSPRVVTGQHFDAHHPPHFENGYYGAFPSNASHGYSFKVQ